MRRRGWRIGLGVGVSVVFLALALRGVEWPEVLGALGRTRVAYLVPMIALSVIALVVRALRWQVLLRSVEEVPLDATLSATAIGFAANLVLPARAGEVLRPFLLSRQRGLRVSVTLATAVLERILDLLCVLAGFGAAVLLLPLPGLVRKGGAVLVVVTVLACVALFTLRGGEERWARWVGVIEGRLPLLRGRLQGAARGFVRGLAALDDPLALAVVLAYSVLLWTVIGANFGLGLIALSLQVPILPAAVTVLAVVALVVSLPSAPGFVGPFQLGCELALAGYGIGPSSAFSFSVVTHLTQFAGTLLPGIYYALRDGVGRRDITAAEAVGGYGAPES